jgi:formiminoglutamase
MPQQSDPSFRKDGGGMKLPILVSLPHAGLGMPPEVSGIVSLAQDDVVKDGDEQAAGVFLELRDRVAGFVTTDIARAFVDVNRDERDFSKDGVVKTHTCWDVPVYGKQPGQELIERLLGKYYHPYHKRLEALATNPDIRVGVDCHTMAAVGPPVAPDSGRRRPAACVSDADGACDPGWTRELAGQLETAIGGEVKINDPFKGGYITRRHARSLPWLQLELSRGDFMDVSEKRDAVARALAGWCEAVFGRQAGG